MKKIFLLFLVIHYSLLINDCLGQSISRKVVAASGGTLSGGSSQLTFTIGETVIPTLAAGSSMLTQGFQQPDLFNMQLQMKAFLQGYYQNAGTASPMDNFGSGGCLFITGLSANANDADNVSVSLINPADGSTAATGTGILKTNGSLAVLFSNIQDGGRYYLKVNQRNSLETWSAAPVMMGVATAYDFTTNASQAYGSNQAEVEPGVYAIYSGDISDGNNLGDQDGVVESSDYSEMENAAYLTLGGYVVQDISGDGVVESTDYSILENNAYLTVVTQKPVF